MKTGQHWAELKAQLKAVVGARYVLDAAADLAVYECDGETLDRSLPDLVVLPKSTDEVAAVVKLAARHNIPLTARGAGTGLSGGATPLAGGISLVLTRMTRIINIDADNFCAHVETGVTNTSVSRPIPPASTPRPSAATWPRTPAARTR